MAKYGLVVEVKVDDIQTHLIADAAAGATVLSVENATQFNSDTTGGAGFLAIGDLEPVEYLSCDEDTITLAAGLAVAADEGDPVTLVLGGQRALFWDAEVSFGEDETVPVPIGFEQRSIWPAGDYDPPVPVLVADDLGAILDAPSRAPVISGVVVRTADEGERVEMSVDEAGALHFYSNHDTETDPGRLLVDVYNPLEDPDLVAAKVELVAPELADVTPPSLLVEQVRTLSTDTYASQATVDADTITLTNPDAETHVHIEGRLTVSDMPELRRYKAGTTTQSLAHNDAEAITFANGLQNQITATTTSTFTLEESGTYFIRAQVTWEPNATGRRMIRIMRQGLISSPGRDGEQARVDAPITGTAFLTQEVTFMLTDGANGDVITIEGYQTSGGNLDVVSAAAGPRATTQLSIVKVG